MARARLPPNCGAKPVDAIRLRDVAPDRSSEPDRDSTTTFAYLTEFLDQPANGFLGYRSRLAAWASGTATASPAASRTDPRGGGRPTSTNWTPDAGNGNAC
jgi:hypothetical protein